jgi:hypothetical protein
LIAVVFLATFGTRERPNRAKKTGCPFWKTRKRARYELLKWGVFNWGKNKHLIQAYYHRYAYEKQRKVLLCFYITT